MSSRVIVTCDGCKQEVEPEDSLKIKVSTDYAVKQYTTQRQTSYDLCRKCVEHVGFKFRDETKSEVEPTTAEQLLEIIQDIAYEEARDAISNEEGI